MLVVWNAIARFFPPALLPGPIPVFERVGGIMVSGQFVVHMAATMLRVAAGFLSAFLGSICLWVLMGVNPTAGPFFSPELRVGLTHPTLPWSRIPLSSVRPPAAAP